MISEDMQNNLIVAAVIVIAMFIGMRALYGYWPWQIHPKLRRVHKEPDNAWPREGFNFQPVAGSDPEPTKPPDFSISPASTAGYKPPLEIDHYDRGYNDNGEDEEPKRSEPEGLANPEADDTGTKKDRDGHSS